MYAIIATGGKQYKVAKDAVVQIEKLKAEIGAEVEFDQVLMVADGEDVKIGAPYLPGAKVIAKVSDQDRGDKITIIKFRRRKHYMRKQGHRQYFTAVRIKSIEA